MTERELLKNALIEINKLEAPALLLDDYLYFINKAVQQYINDVYNRYETSQQTTDDLRVLRRTATLEVLEDTGETTQVLLPNESSEFYCLLPTNYLHLLNCIVGFKAISSNQTKNRCGKPISSDLIITSPARKLTADIYPSVLNNAYFKPSYKTPYYIITRSYGIDEVDPYWKLAHIIDPTIEETDPQSKLSSSTVRMEIRCGNTNKYIPNVVYIDYLKNPEPINITEEDIDSIEDMTKELEFPEYVCYEIINRFVMLIMENASDPRLQTNIPVNQSIAKPGQK